MNADDEWVKLSDLRDGAIFETRTGVRAVKSEYHYPRGAIQVVLLASGEYGHFAQGLRAGDDVTAHNATMVRELSVGGPVSVDPPPDNG